MYPFDRFHPVHCLSVFLNVVIWNSIYFLFIRLLLSETNFFFCLSIREHMRAHSHSIFFPTDKEQKNGFYNISGQSGDSEWRMEKNINLNDCAGFLGDPSLGALFGESERPRNDRRRKSECDRRCCWFCVLSGVFFWIAVSFF